MRKATFAIIFAFAFLIVLALMLTQSLSVLQRVARVSDVSGTVTITPSGEELTKPLGEKRLVRAGDKLSTAAEARLSLNWIDGTRIRMEPETTLTVEKCQVASGVQEATFRLDVGKIWVRVLKMLSQQDKFEINTPTATAGVRGTVFAVQVAADGSTVVSVFEGQVTLAGEGGNVEVTANSQARVDSGRGGLQVTRLSTQQQQAWNQQIKHLGPYLEITSPSAGQRWAGNSVTVTGRCERHATLTVNGQAVQQKSNGRFSAELTTPTSQDYFIVTATASDSRGYTTTVERQLSRPR